VDYYQFKSPLFLMGTQARQGGLVNQMLARVQDLGVGRQAISMCKDDAIFICDHPVH
jgi:hypothetical protein